MGEPPGAQAPVQAGAADAPPATYSALPHGISLHTVPRSLKMLCVFETELDAVSTLGASVHLTFFGIAVGAAIAFGLTLATVTLSGPRTFAAHVALFAVSSAGSMYFGIRGVGDYRRASKKLKDIKENRQAS
jgi:membrane protein implicated in regulation of membrane protease activity